MWREVSQVSLRLCNRLSCMALAGRTPEVSHLSPQKMEVTNVPMPRTDREREIAQAAWDGAVRATTVRMLWCLREGGHPPRLGVTLVKHLGREPTPEEVRACEELLRGADALRESGGAYPAMDPAGGFAEA